MKWILSFFLVPALAFVSVGYITMQLQSSDDGPSEPEAVAEEQTPSGEKTEAAEQEVVRIHYAKIEAGKYQVVAESGLTLRSAPDISRDNAVGGVVEGNIVCLNSHEDFELEQKDLESSSYMWAQTDKGQWLAAGELGEEPLAYVASLGEACDS